MSITVRAGTTLDDLRAGMAPIWHYFGHNAPHDEQVNFFRRVMAPERVHVALEDGGVVGAAAAFAFELTVPGGRIAAAGVTMVAVLPTHRRRGVLGGMMRAQLDACRERRECVAYLWATEDTIYDRFGYGIASMSAEIDLPKDRSRFHGEPQAPASTRLVELKQALPFVAPVYERAARATPGMFARSNDWWQVRLLIDPPWRRGDQGDLQCAVLELEGAPAAYALYRHRVAFDRGVQTGSINVVEAIGSSPHATCAIWRYLCDIDWMAQIKAALLPVDHPLLLLVAEPRRLRFSIRDGLWVRLVDVGAALAARSYEAVDPIVVEVDDAFCPWNAGRWRIGPAGVARTNEPADVRCNVNALGSVYLGGFTWSELARALRIEELKPAAVRRADRLFRRECAPWCPEIF
jgi:predicted acetyltransferase